MMRQMIEEDRRHAKAPLPAQPDAREWITALAAYRAPNLARSLAELAVTAVPFVALWLLTAR